MIDEAINGNERPSIRSNLPEAKGCTLTAFAVETTDVGLRLSAHDQAIETMTESVNCSPEGSTHRVYKFCNLATGLIMRTFYSATSDLEKTTLVCWEAKEYRMIVLNIDHFSCSPLYCCGNIRRRVVLPISRKP